MISSLSFEGYATWDILKLCYCTTLILDQLEPIEHVHEQILDIPSNTCPNSSGQH